MEPLEAFPVSFCALCVPGSHLSGDAFSGLVGGPEQQVHRPVSPRALSRRSEHSARQLWRMLLWLDGAASHVSLVLSSHAVVKLPSD